MSLPVPNPDPDSRPPAPTQEGGFAPVPAAARPAPRAAKPVPAGGYTHRTWMDEMADVLTYVAEIHGQFAAMLGGLEAVEAGRTQLDLVEDCRRTGLQVMRRGVGLVEDTDARYQPVHDAIRRAGGLDEVVRDKNYHVKD